jgi:alpha-glutamyl/putrescinyl thymine pyrophosphorylase clade 1
LRREAGEPRPWTKDAILSVYKFTNVYREHDRVTRWMAKNVREPLADDQTLVHACIAFRWFNRIKTGEAIFKGEPGYLIPWFRYIRNGRISELKEAIIYKCDSGPYVTGAYIIKTPAGMNKLDGVLSIIDSAMPKAVAIQKSPGSLEQAYNILLTAPYMGTFTAAQVIADLKYTPRYRDAKDWYTFVHSGPGSRAGLNLLLGRPRIAPWKEGDWVAKIQEMREALTPKFVEQGWEIPHAQDVQNNLCEFSKYIRGFSRNTFVPTKEAI